MLAGLLFATSDAADQPDALTATLPFGGASLIEFQARMLIAAGASQILIAVARVTPELLGAAARIGKRGVAVDIVRSAVEAAAKVHPLARVVVLADGLITTEQQLAPFVTEDDSALLLVTDEDNGLERIDGSSHWAGIARVGAQRLAETAALPRDYDFLSALLRVTAQQGAAKLPLAAQRRDGHGIEHDAQGLARRGRAIYASLNDYRVRWVDRWLFGPLARLTLPPLVAKGASPLMLLSAGIVLGAGGLAAIWYGWTASGLGAVSVASGSFALAGMLAWLRGDDGLTTAATHLTSGVAAGAILLTGFGQDSLHGTATGSVLAVALVIAAGLVERIGAVTRPRLWWSSPAAYPLLLIPFAAAAQSLTGLAALALYAAGSLLGGIEDARAKP